MLPENIFNLPAPPLPSNVSDLLAQRRKIRTRSLHDDIEECHLKLWEIEGYRNFFKPLWQEETIEGSFYADELMLALKLRDFAVQNRMPIASSAKLADIVKSIRVVCRRYRIDRKYRKSLIGGDSRTGGSL